MKNFLLIVLFLAVVSCSNQKRNTPLADKITDDLGNEFVFDKIPGRVITLAPNLTEMIYSLGLENYLIGNTLYCNYPAAAKRITKVGDMLSFDYEKIVTLKPDLIFITVEGNTKETYEKFRGLGLKLFVSNPRNFAGIKKTYLDFGRIFGIKEKAEREISAWDSIAVKVSKGSEAFRGTSVLFLVELQPLMLAGKNTFLNEYLEFCGLKNIAADSPMNYPVFSREEILKRNPDYIIYPSDGRDDISVMTKTYPEWRDLKAIKEGHVIFADRDLYFRPGPRFAYALEDLYNHLNELEKKN